MTSDREPPVFNRVGDERSDNSSSTSGAPLFTSVDDRSSLAADTVVTAPVARPTSRGRLRWAVAGLATILVFVLVGGVLVLAQPRAGSPSVVEYYVPADTAAYFDMRLDLPGDQQDNLAAFMSHFPGFADPAAFQQKLDEMLDQVLQRVDSGLEWQRDVEPWFGGQIGVYGQTLTPTEGTPPSMVAALTVKDRAALEAFLSGRLADHEVDTVDHQGSQIRSFTNDPSGDRVSYAVTNELLLVSPRLEDIQTALDVKAGIKPALAQDQFYLQQLGALHSDRLGTAYYDMGRVMDSMQAAAGESPVEMFGTECLADLQASSRARYVAEVRAEDDHLEITTRAQPPTGDNVPPLPQNKATALAASMPGDALAYAEFRQVGANARAMIAAFLQCLDEAPQGEQPFDPRMIEQFLGVAPEDYLDFVDDAAVAITFENDRPGGGLVATVDDEAVASQRVDRLVTSVRAFVAFGDDDSLTVEEIDHNGATVTIFTVASTAPDAPPMSVAVSVANGRLYIGLEDFVTSALDRQQADSLAASASFQSAIAAGGAENAGVMFVDVARARAALESTMDESARDEYETEAKPFLEPLTTVSVVNRSENGIAVAHIFVHVE
jgi:hypothetical protein